jgi:hypothetical protein
MPGHVVTSSGMAIAGSDKIMLAGIFVAVLFIVCIKVACSNHEALPFLGQEPGFFKCE